MLHRRLTCLFASQNPGGTSSTSENGNGHRRGKCLNGRTLKLPGRPAGTDTGAAAGATRWISKAKADAGGGFSFLDPTSPLLSVKRTNLQRTSTRSRNPAVVGGVSIRGPTLPRLGDKLVGDQLCPRLHPRTTEEGGWSIGANAMRSVLAFGLLIALCASAYAARVHHSKPRHVTVRTSQGVDPRFPPVLQGQTPSLATTIHPSSARADLRRPERIVRNRATVSHCRDATFVHSPDLNPIDRSSPSSSTC